jgi:hypothetical protein
MKAETIINQLAIRLPKFTDKFTTDISITGLARVGTTVTATTAAIHNLAINKQVNIVGAKTPLAISSLTRVGTVGTLVTTNNHDLTENYIITTVDINGATEAEFNGTFNILNIPNRKTITFTMADAGPTTATGSPLLLNGSSYLQQYNGLHQVTSVPTTTTFTYEVADSTLFTPPQGTIIARTNPRISGAISVERVIDAYTKQVADDWWLFAILDDVIASKNRNIDTDAVDNQQRGNEFRQQIVQPFTLMAVTPANNEIAARAARDTAEELFRPICQSILFSKMDSELYVGAQNPIQFVDHGFLAYNTAFYAHGFNFQATADITFDDTIGFDDDVAFRDIELQQFLDFGTKEDPLTADIDLDDTVLP